MRRALYFVVLLAVLTLGSAAAFGATYYVATTGNDSWPGSEAEPWATLQKAVDTIAAGDTAIVKPGTYAGCRMRSSGSNP